MRFGSGMGQFFLNLINAPIQLHPFKGDPKPTDRQQEAEESQKQGKAFLSHASDIIDPGRGGHLKNEYPVYKGS